MTDEMNWMDNRLEINFDAGVRCALQCSKCMRRHYPDKLDKKVTGHDTSLEDFQKIINWFDTSKPLSGFGKMILGESYILVGDKNNGTNLIKEGWITADLSKNE